MRERNKDIGEEGVKRKKKRKKEDNSGMNLSDASEYQILIQRGQKRSAYDHLDLRTAPITWIIFPF